jgi:hypothetical protein
LFFTDSIPFRLDFIQSRLLTLICLARRDYLAVGGNQIEVILAARTLFEDELPGQAFLLHCPAGLSRR